MIQKIYIAAETESWVQPWECRDFLNHFFKVVVCISNKGIYWSSFSETVRTELIPLDFYGELSGRYSVICFHADDCSYFLNDWKGPFHLQRSWCSSWYQFPRLFSSTEKREYIYINIYVSSLFLDLISHRIFFTFKKFFLSTPCKDY